MFLAIDVANILRMSNSALAQFIKQENKNYLADLPKHRRFYNYSKNRVIEIAQYVVSDKQKQIAKLQEDINHIQQWLDENVDK